MKILAVDYGEARTGLATCDADETIAFPLSVIAERDFALCAAKVAEAALENSVGEIVVGNPIHMNGTRGEKSLKCEQLAGKLRGLTALPVTLWDERLTTVSAHNILNEANRRGKKRRETVDGVAAAVILESYLGYRKNKKAQR